MKYPLGFLDFPLGFREEVIFWDSVISPLGFRDFLYVRCSREAVLASMAASESW